MMITMPIGPSILRYMLTCVLMLGFGLAPSTGRAEQADGQPDLEIRPATISPFATSSMMLDVTRAGERIVAVGDRGVVLLSDDEGQTWRQPAMVPINATLNAVSFVDSNTGWSVGHWGVILNTVDGGETWQRQRLDTSEDRPLFSVHFSDARHGTAVGLWSLLLRTEDGGQTWQELTLDPPPGDTRAESDLMRIFSSILLPLRLRSGHTLADRNLMRIFADKRGHLFIAGERGTVLRSTDQGRTWRYHETGYHGSFWTGVALPDGTLLIAGLRGSLYRSLDGGETWAPVHSGTSSSITGIVALDDRVFAVALDGVTLESVDRGENFVPRQRDDRIALTTVAALRDGRAIIFSRTGVLAD